MAAGYRPDAGRVDERTVTVNLSKSRLPGAPFRVAILCNAFEDRTRIERAVTTDGPAGSRKIFLLAAALRRAGVSPLVISLGRGRQVGDGSSYPTVVRRYRCTPIIYQAFLNRPVLSEVLSTLGSAAAIWRLRRLRGTTVLMLYNRHPAYLVGLFLARLLGLRTVLDYEDGPVHSVGRSPRAIMLRAFNWLFDRLCTGGTMLASSVLLRSTSLRPAIVYYGSVQNIAAPRSMANPVLNILLGGSIDVTTGALRLVEAIKALRRDRPLWATQISFEVSGKGDAVEALQALASPTLVPPLRVWGRLDDGAYRDMLDRIDVGLALKPNNGVFADTTFPSKVVEIAAAGQLVVTTDISDVRRLFGDGALYLDDDAPATLIARLRWIVEHRAAAREIAARGGAAVWRHCDPSRTGVMVRDFMREGTFPPEFAALNSGAATRSPRIIS